uniref:tetratricopeptide repeat protein n=1 Tax=Pedobacter schmidteae TaxID=2201271 RepID=UPI000EADC7A1|nr:tetratricopeptide repeat protein [Pedobacter schmidteae]
MKKLFLFILICICCNSASAQRTDQLDYEKLLQYYQTKQYNNAVTYLREIYKDSSDVKKLQQLAYANLMAGHYADAEKAYLQLNAQAPGNIEVLSALAGLYIRINQSERAVGLYNDVITADSSNFNAYKQLAKLSPDLQSSSTKSLLIKANRLNNSDAEVAAQLSDFYFRENQFTKAEEVLKPALETDSNNLLLLNAKIPVCMALKKYNQAIKTGKKIIATHKTPPENLLFQMAMSYRGVKDYKTATSYFQFAIKEAVSPKIASYYGLLGDSYESMNQNKEALETYKRGLLFENNGSLYYNIALLYEDKLNDKKNAISYYNQYLESIKDPEKQKRHIAYIKNKIEELKR